MHSSLKQILVHLDASPRGAKRLEVARALAGQHGAALAALYAVAPGFIALPYVPDLGPSAAGALAQVDAERRARVRAAFDTAMDEGSGPRATWAETDEVPIVGAFAEQALYADLLVLGQNDPDESEAITGVLGDFAESVLAASGKPALVVPYTGGPWNLGGGTAVIAWKATPEAARAVQAALPLLQRAERVHVLSWYEGTEVPVRGARLDLRGYLRLHGIEAEWRAQGEAPDELGEVLLSRACDLQADLLVMGCYGHSRAREWVLGGTSRSVLRGMTLPVLMAH